MAVQIFFDDVQVGDEIPSLSKDPITEVHLVKYAGASGDFNPLHTVDSVGKQAGFGGVIAHGMLVMGFVGQAITGWIPNSNLTKFKVRFAAVTRPGDVITVTGRVTEKIAEGNRLVCTVQAADQRDEVKIKGSFEAKLPAKR